MKSGHTYGIDRHRGQADRTLLFEYISVDISTLSLLNNEIKSLDPLRAKKIFIRKAEDWPYLGFGYRSLISDPIKSGKRSRRKIL